MTGHNETRVLPNNAMNSKLGITITQHTLINSCIIFLIRQLITFTNSYHTMSDSNDSDHEELDDTIGFAARNMFDAYFSAFAKSSKTTPNVFSSLVDPLPEDKANILPSDVFVKPSHAQALQEAHYDFFQYYIVELLNGFNIIFYGLGSKFKVLNKFATEICRKRGHVVVANAFQSGFSFKDLLQSIEKVPGIESFPLPSGGLEGRTRRIYDFFSPNSDKAQAPKKVPLFLIIHNIDASAFRASKARSYLSTLALNPHIHIIASVDNVNASLSWSTSDIWTRKHDPQKYSSTRGFAWLWHDVTTLQGHDIELASADPTNYLGASSSHLQGSNKNAVGTNRGGMSESAAVHVLASVTSKAKKLFHLMVKRQITSQEELQANKTSGVLQPEQYGITYDGLFTLARDDFIATSDTALRALLGEFLDHGLIISSTPPGSDGGEVLWIPLSRVLLKKFSKELEAEY